MIVISAEKPHSQSLSKSIINVDSFRSMHYVLGNKCHHTVSLYRAKLGFLYKSAFNEPWKRWLLNNSLLHSSSTASNYIVYNYIIVQYNVCPTTPEFYYCTTLWHQRKSPFHFHSQPLSLCLVSQHKCIENCTFDCWMHQTSLPASAEIRK